jgi:glycosyltransferase involved in cell wall biosynthesis
MASTRVLHVLDHSLPHLSGYSVRSRYLLEAQRALQLTPLAVTSPKHGSGDGCEEIEGIRYFRTPARPASSKLPLLAEVQLMRQLAARLRDIVRQEQVHVLHAHSPVLNGIPALGVARRAGIPVVYEIRAFWEDAAVDHGTHRQGSLRYRAIRALETWLSRRVDAVGVISEGLAVELARRGISPAKIFRIPNGVDTEMFRPMQHDPVLMERWGLQGKIVVGFIGSFYRYEGLDVLLQAWAKKDPIQRLEEYLLSRKIMTRQRIAHLDRRIQNEVDAAIADAEARALPKGETALEGVYCRPDCWWETGRSQDSGVRSQEETRKPKIENGMICHSRESGNPQS